MNCPYCNQPTVRTLVNSRPREKPVRVKKFCKSSHAERFYNILRRKNIEDCRKVTEQEKTLWYAYKGVFE